MSCPSEAVGGDKFIIKVGEKEMIKISEKELVANYIKGKCCVVVYPDTGWMERFHGNEFLEKGDFVVKRLRLNNLGDIMENKFFIYVFTEHLEKPKNYTELESYKFFKTFKEQYEEDDMFFVQLFVDGKFADENT